METDEARPSDVGAPRAGRLPTFLIVASPKSGTTALAAYLAEHPQVFMSEDKELHFFDDQYDRGLDWYRSNFAEAGDAVAVGEATPTYYMHESTVDRMAEVLPSARLVALIRNPIEAAWSNYWMQRSLGFERRSFEDALRDEREGRRYEHRAVEYAMVGRYADLLQRMCERYPRESLLVKLFEDLRDAPDATFAEVCRHIGVDDSFTAPSLGAVVNPSTKLRSERLRHLMLKYRAWRRLPFGLAMAIDRLNRYEAKYPAMDPATRSVLADLYREPNEELGRWLGRDLSGWA
jgi:sulfotransferase family protein